MGPFDSASVVPARKEKWTSGDAYEIWMGRWSRLLAAEFLPWLPVPPGARWLDVCCGGGVLSDEIARRCRPALVLGLDCSPPQIDFARRNHARPSVEFHLGDAEALPFPAAQFDDCVCGLGINFISNPAAALSEMRRVVRPSGVVAAYVWDYAGRMQLLREFWDVAREVDPQAREFDQALRFPICAPEALKAAFAAAGLENSEIRNLDITTRFSTFEDYWAPFQLEQGSAPVYLASRSSRVRQAIRERLKAVLPAAADGSIVLTARALAIRASRAN